MQACTAIMANQILLKHQNKSQAGLEQSDYILYCNQRINLFMTAKTHRHC